MPGDEDVPPPLLATFVHGTAWVSSVVPKAELFPRVNESETTFTSVAPLAEKASVHDTAARAKAAGLVRSFARRDLEQVCFIIGLWLFAFCGCTASTAAAKGGIAVD